MIITKKQKKILMIAAIASLAFIIFIFFIYLPAKNQSAMLKNEYQIMDTEILQLKKTIEEGKTLENAIVLMREKLKWVEAKFPDKEEATLREISNLAVRMDIEVTSLRPQKKVIIQDVNGAVVNISGCFAQAMPISMSLVTTYKKFGDFLKILKTDFPIFVRINNIQMAKAGNDKAPGLLNVELNLDTYLLCTIPDK